MKSLFFPVFAAAAIFSSALADEILLNPTETPEEIAAYYIDDMENSGEVNGPQGAVIRMDKEPMAILVGDLGSPDTPGRLRKYFLLFHLPALAGKKPTQATLRLSYAGPRHEAEENPMPQAMVFHAKSWDDQRWLSDPNWHGLQTSHFADGQAFSKGIPLCGPDTPLGLIELDVTDMIQEDYRRSDEPVAAFRLEVSGRDALDITDNRANFHVFSGPGQFDHRNNAPTLVLSFE